MDDGVEVGQDDGGRGAECAQLLVHLVQRPVGVRLLEDQVHPLGHVIEPELDGLIGVHVRVRRAETEPGPRRRGGAAHEPRAKRPQRPDAGVVIDVVVAPVALVAVLAEVAATARQKIGGNLLPMRNPGRPFGAQLPPPLDRPLALLVIACHRCQLPRSVLLPRLRLPLPTPPEPVSMVDPAPILLALAALAMMSETSGVF